MNLQVLMVIAGTVVCLALIAWLMLTTMAGLRGREPFETSPGELLRRVRELEDRVEQLERRQRGS
ncbi:MAG: hypothetical protein HPY44_11490 [Armatimonadetes bacterium]|nr:hypothetical protein [Armatimonadota bacterium]